MWHHQYQIQMNRNEAQTENNININIFVTYYCNKNGVFPLFISCWFTGHCQEVIFTWQLKCTLVAVTIVER